MRRLEGFTHETRLGTGRAGEVVRAIRASSGVAVAIREVPHPVGSAGWEAAERDLSIVLTLRHPSLVQLHDVVIAGGVPHLVMEYVPEGSVEELVARRRAPLSIPETVMVGAQAAAALAAAHEVDVVHDGVRPRNLLIDEGGQVKLADLGVSALRDSVRRRLSHGAGGRGPARGRRHGPEADVSQLGEALADLSDGQRRPRHDTDADVPADVRTRLARALAACRAVDPRTRPTAASLRDEFEALAAELGDLRCWSLGAAATARDRPVSATPATLRTTATRSAPLAAVSPRPVAAARHIDATDVAVVAGFLGLAVVASLVLVAVRSGDSSGGSLSGGTAAGGTEAVASIVTTSSSPPEATVPAATTTSSPPTSTSTAPASTTPVLPPPTSEIPTTPPTTPAPTQPPETPPPTTEPVVAPDPTVDTPNDSPVIVGASATDSREDSEDSCGSPTSYRPDLAADGDNGTAWIAEGDAAGESITFVLAAPSMVRQVGLVPGYDKIDECTGDARFEQMRRITAVRWSFEDGTEVDQDLLATPEMHTIELESPVETATVTLTVLATTPPGEDRLDHTPISEVSVG